MWPYVDIPGLMNGIFDKILGTEQAVAGNAELALFWLGFWSMSLSVVAIIGITYLLIRLNESVAEEKAMYAPAFQSGETVPMVNESWERVLRYIDSENPSDWKLAIIEADAMLDDMLKKMGMPGENMGERLKAVEPADFDTLDAAWEAHKIRNQIAHQSGFAMSSREVRRVIDLYQRVFTEFKYI